MFGARLSDPVEEKTAFDVKSRELAYRVISRSKCVDIERINEEGKVTFDMKIKDYDMLDLRRANKYINEVFPCECRIKNNIIFFTVKVDV